MKIFFRAVLVLAAAAALLWFTPLKGQWVDDLVSRAVSAKTMLRVSAKGVEISKFSRVWFNEIGYTDKSGNPLADLYAGKLRCQPSMIAPAQKRNYLFSVSNVRVAKGMLKNLPIGPLRLDKYFEDGLQIRNLTVFAKEDTELRRLKLRILRWESDQLVLRGGLEVESGRMSTCHLALSVPHNYFERLPKEVRASMIRRGDKWLEVKIIYRQRNLTVLGARGPFFRFQWQ